MNLKKAHDWLERSGKHPRSTKEGFWRWVLPEPGKADTTSELPEPVFNRLRGNGPRPWLYFSAGAAKRDAVEAVADAMSAGWNPGT